MRQFVINLTEISKNLICQKCYQDDVQEFVGDEVGLRDEGTKDVQHEGLNLNV